LDRDGWGCLPLKKHDEGLRELVRQKSDPTLEEIKAPTARLAPTEAGIGSVWRFLDRHGISFKKKRSGG
jgi:transposase